MIFKVFILAITGFSPILQDTTAISQLPRDNTEIEVRTVPQETLDSLLSSGAFTYEQSAPNPESLWSRIQRWLIQAIGYIMDNPWASVIIRFIFIAIFAIVFIGLINQILGGNLSNAFKKTTSEEPFSLNIETSEFKNTDYDQLLDQALRKENYSNAVKILYLKALQQLSETELITWKADKTNHDYVREMVDHPGNKEFNQLTYFYEYIEYGDFSIDREGYDTVENIFSQFQHKILS